MAVQRKIGELPPGAVIVSEKDALTYQWKLISDWEPQGDVWPFKYGSVIISASSSFSAIFINNHYRKKLNLRNIAKFSSFVPSVVLPAIMSTVFHNQFVRNDVLIGKTLCPVCVEVRAAGLQCLFSTIYPCIMAPLAAASFATRYYTYKIPSVIQNPKGVLQLWKKITLPIGNSLLISCAINAFVASTVTYFEAKAYFRIQNKLIKLEQEFEENQTISS